MSRSNAPAIHIVETNRMGLKAPGILTFLISMVMMLAVLSARYFNATIPGLEHATTQFAGLLVAYMVLLLGCLLRAL